MSLSNKRIFTAAITGAIHTPTMSKYLPITPEQIADEALAAHEAGAAVAHIHVRDPETGLPSADQDLFVEIIQEIKAHSDMIVCTTTGGRLGEPTQKRVKVVSTIEPELASLNAGSLNFALFHVADKFEKFQHDWEKMYLEATEDFIFPNTFKTMREFLEIFNARQTKPEFEIYDVGMINNLAHLIKAGHVKTPVYLQFVMGILGGIPATPQNLMFLHDTATKLIPEFEFSVCAAGRHQFRMGTQSLLLGGHVRVGLEDNLFLEKGVLAKSNGDQVRKIVRIAKELDVEPATPDEARQMLGLKGIDKLKL